MSEILSKFANCEQITEWLNPHDPRLILATGEDAPNQGANVREAWFIEEDELTLLAHAVKKLIVPESAESRVTAAGVGDSDFNRVVLRFEEPRDWHACFPTEESTHIITRSNGEKAWAAIGLCGAVMGLAVFAREKAGTVEAKIQAVPDDIFSKLIDREKTVSKS